MLKCVNSTLAQLISPLQHKYYTYRNDIIQDRHHKHVITTPSYHPAKSESCLIVCCCQHPYTCSYQHVTHKGQLNYFNFISPHHFHYTLLLHSSQSSIDTSTSIPLSHSCGWSSWSKVTSCDNNLLVSPPHSSHSAGVEKMWQYRKSVCHLQMTFFQSQPKTLRCNPSEWVKVN